MKTLHRGDLSSSLPCQRQGSDPGNPPSPEVALTRSKTIADLNPAQLSEGLMRPRELAGALGISRSTLFAWITDGRIPSGIKLGRSVRAWPRAALPEIIAALSQKGAAND